MSERRDIELGAAAAGASGSSGHSVIAVIGIDCYRSWRRLTNAVGDARGAAALFGRLGFEQVTALIDDQATGKAIEGLVRDDLKQLGPDDSLVLFYAGHGGTQTHRLGSRMIKTGHLIPVDASERAATWIDLDGWLRAVSLLPAKHILVILDACHSGIALGPILKWRDLGTRQDTPLSTLNARRSRRIITSALDDQIALDSGPVYGHSLFTGCLIEGLTHGLGRSGRRVATGSELGLYLQRRVETYPNSRQTPDFGAFDFDDRGELVIPLAIEQDEPTAPVRSTPHAFVQQVLHGRPRERAGGRTPRWEILIAAAGTLLVLARVASSMLGKERSPHPVDAARVAAHAPSDASAPSSHDAAAVVEGAPFAVPGSCPVEMVRVPAGTFQMGSPEGKGDGDQHPQHAVTLSGYCIDRTEVTVKAYDDCVAAKGCVAAPLTVKWSGYSTDEVKQWSRYCNRRDRPDHPINCVDWDQAAAYCKWAGKRLPTEAEWEYAARHDPESNKDYDYPWGNEAPSAKRLNACGSECVAMAKRDLSLDWKAVYGGNDGWETTARVGSYRDGASPFGALDMAGNVWEWTADWYGAYEGASSTNPQGPETGEYRVNRGGGWVNLAAGFVRSADRDWDAPTTRIFNMGFRCACAYRR